MTLVLPMRLIFPLLFLLSLSLTAGAQNLTGIWRGYFSSSNGLFRGDTREDTYKYEVQISQLPNNGIKGITYSYKTTVFYAKTGLQGRFTAQAKSLTLKETNIIDLKIEGNSMPCLMTCYLDYSKIGKLEILQGDFISVSINSKRDCGSGKVYLEKVTKSDFKKEDFLLKKKAHDTVQSKPVPGATSKPASPKPSLPKAKQVKPFITPHPISPVPDAVVKTRKADTTIPTRREPVIIKTPVPKILLERENRLVRTIYTDEENIQVDLYDNGTIDNDTISLYHNNQLVVSNGRLSYSPITYRIRCDKNAPHHELVIVAENLGEIPPNTALMVITMGRNVKRYEIFLTSTEQRNAKVVIEYRPGG